MHRVAVLLLPPVVGFDAAIAPTLFSNATDAVGNALYDVVTCALTPGPVAATTGFDLLPAAGPEALATADTVVIPGTRFPSARTEGVLTPEASEAFARIRPGTRLVSICTGAFVLAAAGLLDGRPATTHWKFADSMRRLHPEVLLDENVLFVDDGDVLTSAGLAAGIDLCLHIIRSDHGAQVANAVARYCVVPPWREGGQAQFIDRQVPAPDHFSTAATREWALQHLDEELTVQRLARHAKMSARTFNRRFREETGSRRVCGCAAAASTAPASYWNRVTCPSTRSPGWLVSDRAATCATTCVAASGCRRRVTARPTRARSRVEIDVLAAFTFPLSRPNVSSAPNRSASATARA